MVDYQGKLGVVVVGVGRAGGVRIRDLLQSSANNIDDLQGVHLVGFVSRRQLSIDGTQQISLEDALSRTDVHAIFVCTENCTHAEIARQALSAKKHVLVEYPLAATASGAKDLLQLAKDNGVVCYEEDIGLLTAQYQKLKSIVKEKPPLQEATNLLEGTYNGWIEHEPPFRSCMSQLHTLVDLFGDLTPKLARIKQTPDKIDASAQLLTKHDRSVQYRVVRERLPTPKRVRSIRFEFEDSSEIDAMPTVDTPPDTAVKPPGLFLQDTCRFVQTVRGQRDNSYNDWLAVRCLEIAEQLQNLAFDSPQSVGI